MFNSTIFTMSGCYSQNRRHVTLFAYIWRKLELAFSITHLLNIDGTVHWHIGMTLAEKLNSNIFDKLIRFSKKFSIALIINFSMCNTIIHIFKTYKCSSIESKNKRVPCGTAHPNSRQTKFVFYIVNCG